MEKNNFQFDKNMIDMIKSMIGKNLIKYRCDPFIFSNSVHLNVGIYIEDKIYLLSNKEEVIDYFGAKEDIGILKIKECKDSEIKSGVVGVKQIDNPIDTLIKEIHIVQENQKLFQKNILTYDYYLTRGLIFILSDDREISFEKWGPFGEEIKINCGHNLLNKFDAIDDSNPDGDPNDVFKTTRSIIKI
ncbi:MAG: hypothetical protein IKO19_07110 [Candidatus Riflebacteria bacterium]|jgi:hypothetical protein|nr:hypothetical protein [Candidatus Riflebacteria bacterium]